MDWRSAPVGSAFGAIMGHRLQRESLIPRICSSPAIRAITDLYCLSHLCRLSDNDSETTMGAGHSLQLFAVEFDTCLVGELLSSNASNLSKPALFEGQQMATLARSRLGYAPLF